MTRRTCATLAVAIAAALPGVAASADRLSWFDEVPARDTLGQVRMSLSPLAPQGRLTFGIDAYKSLQALEEPSWPALRSPDDGTVLRFYGEFAPRTDDLYLPFSSLHPSPDGETPLLSSSSSRLSGFGIKLQHRVDAYHTFAFSAGYSEIQWSIDSPRLDALDTRAALSWRGKWSGAWQPGLSGTLFFGDESLRDEAYRQLGRRYYGFALGGELRVGQDHTPYLSYRLKRSFYSPEDPAYPVTPYEDQSQLSAGWRWQVQPNWSLQAEARYGLNGTQVDPYSPDRSHFFFGTRFDFR